MPLSGLWDTIPAIRYQRSEGVVQALSSEAGLVCRITKQRNPRSGGRPDSCPRAQQARSKHGASGTALKIRVERLWRLGL